MSLPVFVLGVGAWPGPAGAAGDSAAAAKPQAQLLTARMRGRASLLTALFADVALQATRAAGLAPRELPSIFGSAYGEMGTLQSLIHQLYHGDGALSPARFQASVHNTAAGQLSIALGNEHFSTSLAAGRDTVAMVLLEAFGWLEHNPGSVLVACADEGASEVLQPGIHYGPLAAACVLSNQPGLAVRARLGSLCSAHAVEPPAQVSCNPCLPALTLVQAVLSGRETTLDLNPGSPCTYSLSVQPVSAEAR